MSETPKTGSLYLIPVPLGLGCPPADCLPPPVLSQIKNLTYFVVEEAKTARAFLKSVGTALPLQSLHIAALNEHSKATDLPAILSPLLAGHDVGLFSEAGCPAIADPGAALVALAHSHSIRVCPLVGPSSLLLALMGSGLDGQRFAFHGYLPIKTPDRAQKIRQLEKESQQVRQTQLFIETPYRNTALFQAILRIAKPSTRLCLAVDLSLPTESIRTRPIAAWKDTAEISQNPTVFLMLSDF